MIKRCNLCGGPIVRLQRGQFGTRCLLCLSTYIHRAVGIVLDDLNLKSDIAVYELSAHGALFKYLKKRFKNLTCSEYFDGVTPGMFKNGVVCQDVQKLTFKDEIFDLVTSTEVFEHVEHDKMGFAEVNRVLKGGGHFVFTVPLGTSEKTIERAVRENGEIKHLVEPTFGGDHLRKNGIIDFRNYGTDIKDRLINANFRKVEIREIRNMTRLIPCKYVIVAEK